MKRLFLALLLVLCCSLLANAQKIHFSDTSNAWKELEPQYDAPGPWILNYYTYSFIGSANFDSVTYRQFNFGFVRDDTIQNKVFIRDVAGDSDILLMDYNLTAGDSFITAYNRFVVLGLDSTLINSVWHKVWQFSMPLGGIYGGSPIIVIEGIGCIQHPTYMFRNFRGCVECSQPSMFCFSNRGTTPPLSPSVSFFDNATSCSTFPTLRETRLQQMERKTAIFPNPTSNELNISSTFPMSTINITNVQGQDIFTRKYNAEKLQLDVSNLPTGMYILRINGTEVRKFMKE